MKMLLSKTGQEKSDLVNFVGVQCVEEYSIEFYKGKILIITPIITYSCTPMKFTWSNKCAYYITQHNFMAELKIRYIN